MSRIGTSKFSTVPIHFASQLTTTSSTASFLFQAQELIYEAQTLLSALAVFVEQARSEEENNTDPSKSLHADIRHIQVRQTTLSQRHSTVMKCSATQT